MWYFQKIHMVKNFLPAKKFTFEFQFGPEGNQLV